MRVELLNLHQDELPKLANWHYQEWHNLYPEKTADDFALDLQESLQQGFVPSTWVLVDNGKVVGSTSLLKQDMSANSDLTPWIANVFIEPGHRGRGLGKVIIKEVMRQAKLNDLSRLYLFTEDQMAFYQNLGWQIIRQHDYNGAEVSVMSIELNTLTNN